MKAIAVFALIATIACSADAARRRVVSSGPPSWSAQLSATSVTSSSRLALAWTALNRALDHYAINAIETAGGPPLSFTAASNATSLELTRLESGTQYRVEIRACIDAACASSIAADASTLATTSDEYWQIRGTGSSFSTAARIVSDGNTKPFAIRWESEAGASLAGTTQLYYDPNSPSEKGIKIATSSDPSASFTSISGFGFLRGDSSGHMGTGPATFQVVPLATGKIRIFWESTDADGKARIYSRDSVDGWTGRDFNSGAATQCQEQDVAAGGACAATLLVGVQGDAINGNPKIKEARQLKIGVPLLDAWTWNEAPGTFMVLTEHLVDQSCSTSFFNAGFALWDGTKWNVQYAANGCPKLIPDLQAPMPVHIGGARYKLYFNQNINNSGNAGVFKPLRMLYADGAATGNPSTVEFEDWETIDRARTVHVRWPSGIELTGVETSQFDDFQVWMPTRDPSLQIIYSNMACPNNGCGPPFLGMATLLNP
ncbi:MAG TPA: fibronectin type III domain-containing protein [Thermoanaerobaculia bacterium]|nr:fibronectin type III domain-containing protein [Thermoanaerobaculia bacterium]